MQKHYAGNMSYVCVQKYLCVTSSNFPARNVSGDAFARQNVGTRLPCRRMVTRRASRGRMRIVRQQLQYPREPATLEAAALEPSIPLQEVQKPAETIPNMWGRCSREYGNLTAVVDPHAATTASLTYSELEANMKTFASGLQSMGLQHGDKVSLFSENSWRWLLADQGIMMCGAVDAVRGTSASVDELSYILSHSDSVGLVVQDAATLRKLLPFIATKTGHNGEAAVNGHAVNGNGNGNGNGNVTGQHQVMLKFIVVLWGEAESDAVSQLCCPVVTFDDVVSRGQQHSSNFIPAPLSLDDTATIVYTSGTTGNPKGVMLSHGNLMYQVNNMYYYLAVGVGEKLLSLLPPWHIYERTVAYFVLSRGCQVTYTNIRKFRDDLTKYPPDYFVCVPLVLDTLKHKVMLALKAGSAVKRTIANAFLALSSAYICAQRVVDGTSLQYAAAPPSPYSLLMATITALLLKPLHSLGHLLVYRKIREAIGIRKCVVSGGGSLANHLDNFYEVIGLPVLNGWGLTETSPVLACRRNETKSNVRGTVGVPMPGTSVRVVDPTSLNDLADGQQGLLLAKGPGVMRGYYKDATATRKAFMAGPGWFDTGDLGWRAPAGVAGSNMGGMITLTGRAKDTIVLTNGKNVEPAPLEDAIQSSPLIKHAIVIGHDHRALGALLEPNAEALEEMAKQKGVDELSEDEVKQVLQREVMKALAHRADFEHVHHVAVLDQPLSFEEGTLTRTMKPRRPQIMDAYKQQVDALNKKLR